MKIGTLLRTLRFITPQQAIYQVKNKIVKPGPLTKYRAELKTIPSALSLLPVPQTRYQVRPDLMEFTFLNLPVIFDNRIEWNYHSHGKLWNYNLQYLDYILQENISEETRWGWITDIYTSLDSGKLKLEPYPVSLRVLNLMRFFSVKVSRIDHHINIQRGLYAELNYLDGNYEFHILGNHILENAFAMLMGSVFFKVAKWKNKANKILMQQLNEQILEDGAHFELSPMYHRIILFRVLEAISYLDASEPLRAFLKVKAAQMLGWLQNMTFSNGETPHFNDSAEGVTFSAKQLEDFAAVLDIETKSNELGASGYRKFVNSNLELIADVHGISPSYQPGHSHADHLSFVLYASGNPFIVDPGTSTYNIGERRNWERSSKAHNTVTVDNQDQSEVWSGFRVGRRATVNIVSQSDSDIVASVSYKGVKHMRKFELLNNVVKISDQVKSRSDGKARFYIHPSVDIDSSEGGEVGFKNGCSIKFDNFTELKINEYEYAEQFNKLTKGKVIEVFFKDRLETNIFGG